MQGHEFCAFNWLCIRFVVHAIPRELLRVRECLYSSVCSILFYTVHSAGCIHFFAYTHGVSAQEHARAGHGRVSRPPQHTHKTQTHTHTPYTTHIQTYMHTNIHAQNHACNAPTECRSEVSWRLAAGGGVSGLGTGMYVCGIATSLLVPT